MVRAADFAKPGFAVMWIAVGPVATSKLAELELAEPGIVAVAAEWLSAD